MLAVLITLIVLYLIAVYHLSGPDLSIYDRPAWEEFDDHSEDQEATNRFLAVLKNVRKSVKRSRSLSGGLRIVRDFADNLSSDLETDTEFESVVANGVPCEWAIPKNADPTKRVLFLHGGAFLFGSPKGHRKFADKLGKITNGVVLSVDYRMLPEHKRGASITDSQAAYKFILKNSPGGQLDLDKLVVAGDSAGGNLALMLSAWSKLNAERQPDAVIGFSPSTDMTLSSPTIKSNQATDKMLGEGLGLLSKIPGPIRAWVGLVSMRINPSNPLASPLFQDLSNLPPTLIHASTNEMLLGEANRYVNRARTSGSKIKFQVWKDQIHDWHLFNMGYGSANSAWNEVEKFLRETVLKEQLDEAS